LIGKPISMNLVSLRRVFRAVRYRPGQLRVTPTQVLSVDIPALLKHGHSVPELLLKYAATCKISGAISEQTVVPDRKMNLVLLLFRLLDESYFR